MPQQGVKLETAVSEGEFRAIVPPPTLRIQRNGCTVQIAMTAGSEYLAIEMFDRMTGAARRGSVRLDIGRLT